VIQELQVKRVNLVTLVILVQKDSQVRKVNMVHLEDAVWTVRTEYLVTMVSQEWTVCLASKERKEISVYLEELAQSENAVTMVNKERQEHQDAEVSTVPRETRALFQVPRENLVTRVLTVSTDHLVNPVRTEKLDVLDVMASPDLVERRDHLVNQV